MKFKIGDRVRVLQTGRWRQGKTIGRIFKIVPEHQWSIEVEYYDFVSKERRTCPYKAHELASAYNKGEQLLFTFMSDQL